MLSRGLTWQAAEQLVEAVLRAHGKLALPQRTFPPYAICIMLGFAIAGLVVSLQYFAVTSVALRPAMAEVTNQYTLVRFLYQAGQYVEAQRVIIRYNLDGRFLYQAGQYVEAAPAPFALSLLGLAVFIAGLLALRVMLPSVYRWGG